jgi:molybdopterin converting factor small subunit
MTLPSTGAPDPPQAAVILLLFAEARVAAGTGREDAVAGSVGELLAAARARYGERFAAVLERAQVWVNGEPASVEVQLRDGDEVAILPPVSGGARW